MVHVGLCILVILDTDSELGVIGGGYKSIRPELAHNLFEWWAIADEFSAKVLH